MIQGPETKCLVQWPGMPYATNSQNRASQTPTAVFFQSSMYGPSARHLDHESLDLVLQASDLIHEIRSLVGGDAGSDDGTADSAGAAQRSLAWYVDVWNVLGIVSV